MDDQSSLGDFDGDEGDGASDRDGDEEGGTDADGGDAVEETGSADAVEDTAPEGTRPAVEDGAPPEGRGRGVPPETEEIPETSDERPTPPAPDGGDDASGTPEGGESGGGAENDGKSHAEDAEQGEDGDDREDAEVHSNADATDPAEVGPSTPTSTWTPGGAACATCGASVERRWHDEAGLVCAACKEW